MEQQREPRNRSTHIKNIIYAQKSVGEVMDYSIVAIKEFQMQQRLHLKNAKL